MHPVAQKLSIFASLTQVEESAIALALVSTLEVAAGDDIVRQEDPPGSVLFLLEGFAVRHKILENGKAQILAIMVPGDPCDLGVSLLEQRDHGIAAVSKCTVAKASDDAIDHLSNQYPKIRDALKWSTLSAEAIAREWIANVGQRVSLARMAHLFCELYYQLKAIGRVDGHSYPLPLTQIDLAHALGITSVHVNRCLQDLRDRKLIAFGDKRLTILDLKRLERLGEFEPVYLHLEARYEAKA